MMFCFHSTYVYVHVFRMTYAYTSNIRIRLYSLILQSTLRIHPRAIEYLPSHDSECSVKQRT